METHFEGCRARDEAGEVAGGGQNVQALSKWLLFWGLAEPQGLEAAGHSREPQAGLPVGGGALPAASAQPVLPCSCRPADSSLFLKIKVIRACIVALQV